MEDGLGADACDTSTAPFPAVDLFTAGVARYFRDQEARNMPTQMSQTLETAAKPTARHATDGILPQPRVDVPTDIAEPGHLHLAREIYEHILSTQPDHLESLKQLGQMDVEQGDYASAIARLSQALEMFPDDAECHNHLGQAYAAVGNMERAEQAHRRALELDPQMTDAHFGLGIALQRQSKLGEAAGSFQQTLRLDRNHGQAFNQLGNTLEEQGNLDEALVCYQEALIKQLVSEAFEIGMLQIRDEIESLARFVLVTKPQNVMEIGSHRGGTMSLWCKLLKNEGKRIAVDLPSGRFGGLQQEVIDARNASMQQWSPNMTIFDADSHDVATYEKVRDTLGNEKLDFLFIDGDHTYEGVKLDYFMYKSLVNKGGFVAFHDIKDTELHRRQDCNVARLWDELTGDKMDIRAAGEWGGIGVIQC